MKRNRKFLIQSFEEEWTCPITSMPMNDPVSTLDGHSYEKESIMDWFKKKKTSPKTGLDLSSQKVIPNIVLKNVISKFQKEFKYEFDKLCTQNTELNEKIEEVEEKAKEKNTKLQNEYKEMKSKYSELLNNSKKVADSLLQFRKQGETLKTQNQELKKQNISLKADVKVVQTLKNGNKMLRQESQKIKKDNQYFLAQNQNLIQQRIQSINLASSAKNQLTAAKKQNDELKALLTKQINQYNVVLAKADECQKMKSNCQQLMIKYNSALEQLKNLNSLLQKNNIENRASNQTDHTKDNEIQRFKLQCYRYRIQNANIKTEIKSASSQIQKIKLDYERLKSIHSFCIIKTKQQQAQNLPIKQPNLIHHNLPQKMDEEKPQRRQKLIFNQKPVQLPNPVVNNWMKKGDQPSKKEQYVPSKPWKAPDSNDKLSNSLDNMKNALHNINQNSNSILDKIKQSSDSIKNLFGVNPQLSNQKLSNIGILNQLQKQQKINQIPQLQPAPLQRVNSQPALQPFRELIKESVGQKMQRMQEETKQIKHILPFRDYLMNNPVLYDEQKHELDHSGYKINMQEFLKHNWSELKTLNISDSQLDDKGFQLLTNEAIFFTSLNHLWIWNNFIVNMPKSALDRFKNLRSVYFSIKGRHANPLSDQSKRYLTIFSNKNPSIQVAYDNKPQ